MLIASPVYAEKPKTISILEEDWLMCQADRSFLTDRADWLTVELAARSEELVMAQESPPECDGPPYVAILCGVIAGFLAGELLD